MDRYITPLFYPTLVVRDLSSLKLSLWHNGDCTVTLVGDEDVNEELLGIAHRTQRHPGDPVSQRQPLIRT